MPIVIDHIALKDILGPPLFEMEVSRTPAERGRAGWGRHAGICRELAAFIIHCYRNLSFYEIELSGQLPQLMNIKAACEEVSQLHSSCCS